MKLDKLRVAARTSTFAFKGRETDVRHIGQSLNVGTVLEGSVRKAGNRLRINVQLINVADGYHLWSERYDRQLKDIFEIQEEIALAIVGALKVKLFGDERARLRMPGFLIDPQFDQIRADERFRNIIKKTGVNDNFNA